MDKWGYNHLIELKTLKEKEKLLIMSNFSSSHNVFRSCLVLMRQNEYLWIKGLRGTFRNTCCLSPSSTISLNIFSSQTAEPVWTKLGRNVPWEVHCKNCSHNLIPSKTLVAMVTKWNFLSNSLTILSSGTADPILK